MNNNNGSTGVDLHEVSWDYNGAESIEDGEASENDGGLWLMERRTRARLHKDRGRVWVALNPPESAIELFGEEGLVPDTEGWGNSFEVDQRHLQLREERVVAVVPTRLHGAADPEGDRQRGVGVMVKSSDEGGQAQRWLDELWKGASRK